MKEAVQIEVNRDLKMSHFMDMTMTAEEKTAAIAQWVKQALKLIMPVQVGDKFQAPAKIERPFFKVLLDICENNRKVHFFEDNKDEFKNRLSHL